MIDKIIRALTIGIIAAVITLVGAGWKAYAEMQQMGEGIEARVMKVVKEKRADDMEWIDKRFNTIERLITGKVVTEKNNTP